MPMGCLPSGELNDRVHATSKRCSGIKRPPQCIRAAEGMYVGYKFGRMTLLKRRGRNTDKLTWEGWQGEKRSSEACATGSFTRTMYDVIIADVTLALYTFGEGQSCDAER